MTTNRFFLTTLALSAFALTLASGKAQTTVPATPMQQTTATPVTDPTAPTAAPLSKSQLKDQRKQQKHAEKSADENVKSQKDAANALKHQNKALNEKEKQQGVAPAPPPQI